MKPSPSSLVNPASSPRSSMTVLARRSMIRTAAPSPWRSAKAVKSLLKGPQLLLAPELGEGSGLLRTERRLLGIRSRKPEGPHQLPALLRGHSARGLYLSRAHGPIGRGSDRQRLEEGSERVLVA